MGGSDACTCHAHWDIPLDHQACVGFGLWTCCRQPARLDVPGNSIPLPRAAPLLQMAPTGWCSWCRMSAMQRRHGARSPRCMVLRLRVAAAAVRPMTLGGRFVRSTTPLRQPLHAQHTLRTEQCDPASLPHSCRAPQNCPPTPAVPNPCRHGVRPGRGRPTRRGGVHPGGAAVQLGAAVRAQGIPGLLCRRRRLWIPGAAALQRGGLGAVHHEWPVAHDQH